MLFFVSTDSFDNCHLGFGSHVTKLYVIGMGVFPWELGCFFQKGNNKDY